MKLKDDDILGGRLNARRLQSRRLLTIGACAVFSLLLCGWLIADFISSEDGHDSQQIRRRPLAERAMEHMEELATVVVPVPARHVPPPCAVNLTGFSCPNAYGDVLNQVYRLEPGDATGPPLYRSSAGYWLVHSPRSCLSRGAWILSQARPDESADAVQGACDIEAHIFYGTQLPTGAQEWSYVSCGSAGGLNVGNRRLTLLPVMRCDCPTAGDASDTDAAI